MGTTKKKKIKAGDIVYINSKTYGCVLCKILKSKPNITFVDPPVWEVQFSNDRILYISELQILDLKSSLYKLLFQ